MKVCATPTALAARKRRLSPDALAVVVLVLVLVCFYWGFLVGRSYIWDDTLTEFYPGVNYFAKSIQAGRFPLWFPGIRDGIPFYSDPQATVFYPPQWVLVPFVQQGRLPFLVYQRYIVLHYLLGGLFMYAFLKQIKLSPIAALTGALVFCFSGFASLHIVNFVIIQVYVWLPLQLLFVHRLTSGRNRWAWLGFVGAAVMSLLAGHQQTTVYCWYLVIGYWLYRRYSIRRNDGLGRRATIAQIARKEMPKLVGTFGLVFGLGAVMLLPAAENWRHTLRPHQSFEVVADISLPYHQLLTLFVPNFFGRAQIESPVQFWGFDPHSWTVAHNPVPSGEPGYWQYWEFGAYAGQLFWLALLLILFNWRRIDDRLTARFFLTTWVVATWFMLGRYGGLFQILYHIVPGASLFRGPAKMACVAAFAAAILSAFLVHLLGRPAHTLRYWPAFLPTAGGACLALALFVGGKHLAPGLHSLDKLNWSRHETVFAVAVGFICALAAAAVVRAHKRWVQTLCLCAIPVVCAVDFHHAYGISQRGLANPNEYYPETDRFYPLLKNYREQYGPVRFGQVAGDQMIEELVTHRNQAYFHDFLEVPEGYTSFYLDGVAGFQSITNSKAKVDIQNIQVIMEKHGLSPDCRLRLRPESFARARFFTRVRRYDSRAALLSALAGGEIDWHNEAAITDPVAADLLRGADSDPAAGTHEEVRFVSKTPEEYSISYDVAKPGIIFVSEAFYPGWVATDARTKLIEVFGAFQGIIIPKAGRGQVVVRFAPSVLKQGMAITIISAALVALLLVFGKWDTSSRGH
jgi:hypothetical protein